MRLLKRHSFNPIDAYELGWSPWGRPFMTVYTYLFDDVMIDTALSHLQKETLQIAADHHINQIYLTHHHEDHSGNAMALKQHLNAKIFGSALTVEKMKAPSHILPYQKIMWGKALRASIDPFPDQITTPLGEMVPVHTPGHAKDHTCYLLANEGILFSGDLYLGDRVKYFRSDENIATQIESLKKVLSLDFHMLLCGHRPIRKNAKQHLAIKLNFLENFYGDILQLWKKGLSESQIFNTLQLKENNMIKMFCFGNVSLFNGVKSIIKHNTHTEKDTS